MELHWLAVLGCLSVLAAPGHPAAVPTQDTLVVSRSNDASTEPAPQTTEEVTTDGPAPPIKLTEMEVISEVSLRYAHTVVVARVRNPAKRAQEASFRVLLPETAFISGFVMTLDGKSYKAYVKEKEEAKQIYDQAVSQGYGGALVAAKARDSNQFVVSVHVEPSSSATFNLTYQELLDRRNDVYNHAINLHPGALVPKLSVTVHIKEAQKITELRVPEIRTGNEIDATKDDAQNSKAVITRGHDDREATITFNPDLEEQKRLMAIYAQKSKESASHGNRWTRVDDEESGDKQGVLGQFVVQYDVERPKDGEILVNDGYFVHFFAPSSLPPLKKFVVFVLDTSGSMMDRKIVQLREAMQTILSDLNPGDYFTIVEFASSVTIHELKEADEEPPKSVNYYWGEAEKKPTLVPPSPATPTNIEKAKVIISRLNAAGGTNIDSALDVAVNLVRKRTEWGKKIPSNTTEATPTTEVTVEQDGDIYNVERMKTLEPIIIFLTDGDPTVGVTSPTTIINRLTEKNYGESKATIFSLAFGEDADRKFLRKLSLRNDGFMRHIYEAADSALQLQDFYRQVSSPLLADVKFVYPANQVKEGSVTKNKFRTLYAGSELVVAGQVAPDAVELTPQVLGFCGNDDFGRKRYERLPKAPIPAKSEALPLERLWSYLTIKQLLDERDAAEGDEEVPKENRPEAKALALALKYEFVTPLTSLVVVKPNATNAVDAESVDKPVSMPFAPQLNLAPAAGYPGFAYSSSFAGAPGAAPPVYASQALSLDSVVEEEELEHYDFIGPAEDEQNTSNKIGSLSSLISTRAYFRPMKPSARRPSYGGSTMTAANLPYPFIASGNRVAAGSFAPLDVSDSQAVSTTPRLPTTESPKEATESSLPLYRLQEFSWTNDLLNHTAEALVINVKGVTVYLKLTKEAEVPKRAEGDEACASAVEGGAGVCVYLTRCDSAKNITSETYSTTYCSVNQEYAGVCCSLQKVDLVKTIVI